MEITPRKPGRPKDPELESRRRAQILDTAAKVFAGFGFAGTQVQVIADRLGVGNGTVYRYFPTKEILFLAAVERGLEELTAEMDAVMTEPLEPLDTLRRLVRVYLGFFHRRPEMAELFIQERAAFPHHHRPLYFARREQDGKECRRADLFHRLIASGRIRSISQERFFAVIGDLLYGTILTNLLTGRRATPDAQTEDVLDVILNGILAAEGEDR
jgi:AcrR family transcriptional regulator